MPFQLQKYVNKIQVNGNQAEEALVSPCNSNRISPPPHYFFGGSVFTPPHLLSGNWYVVFSFGGSMFLSSVITYSHLISLQCRRRRQVKIKSVGIKQKLLLNI